MRRRMRPFKNLETGRAIRVTIIVYFITGPILLFFTLMAYWGVGTAATGVTGMIFTALKNHAPISLGMVCLAGAGLILLLNWKCSHCRSGPGKRISTALEKMSHGDLGWKITLRRGDELAGVADSVTRASESLADRISKMQMQTRQLTEVENYLIDLLDTGGTDPYTLKALRKLKICTSRLNANMQDFQVSAIAAAGSKNMEEPEQSPRELQKT